VNLNDRKQQRFNAITRISYPLLIQWLLAISSAAFPAGLLAQELKSGHSRPNIIFILADDLGPGDVGFSGGKITPTPNIDRLAKEGIVFTQYYSAAPICSPSRCGLITGQFPARWNLHSYLQTIAGNKACGQADYLDPAAPSLPELLKQNGYRTAHFGKWHLGGGRDVQNAPKFASYGYDEHASTWESPEPHPDITSTNWIWADSDRVSRWQRTAFFVDKSLDFLARNRNTPCFVNLWLDDPHTPWVPSKDAIRKDTRPNLAGVMREVDRQIGRLLNGLKTMGLDSSTLVIFTSDNGPLPTFQGERSSPYRGSKLSLFEGGIRVPFAARWPGTIPAGLVNQSTPLAAVDMLPTLAGITKTNLPAPLASACDGEDLSAALLGREAPKRSKDLFWQYGLNETSYVYPKIARDKSPSLAIRSGDHVLLANADGSNAQLFNLTTDPSQNKNLAKSDPNRADLLKDRLNRWKISLPAAIKRR
jgi:arylsulfatase A-like enzyme